MVEILLKVPWWTMSKLKYQVVLDQLIHFLQVPLINCSYHSSHTSDNAKSWFCSCNEWKVFWKSGGEKNRWTNTATVFNDRKKLPWLKKQTWSEKESILIRWQRTMSCRKALNLRTNEIPLKSFGSVSMQSQKRRQVKISSDSLIHNSSIKRIESHDVGVVFVWVVASAEAFRYHARWTDKDWVI